LEFVLKFLFFLLLFISELSLASSQLFVITGKTMGTSYSIKLLSHPPVPLKQMIDAKLEQVNDQMSTYRDDSEISRFNRFAADKWFAVSKETATVALEAEDISRKTNGSFDSTVGKLVNKWGFGPDGRATSIPTQKEISNHLSHSGWEKVEVRMNPPALRKKDRALYLDYSGIAKGFGVDEIANLLESIGVMNYMVEIGGEIRTAGSKLDSPWRIAIEVPKDGRHIFSVIKLENDALATSGDYRNYREEGGKRLSHLIDPKSGKPITHKLASVSVIADTSAKSDAWATALIVMGEKMGMEVAKKQGLKVYMIVRSDDGFKSIMTKGFKPYLLNEGR
jgi:thiamine biosynthesis lipoprotein